MENNNQQDKGLKWEIDKWYRIKNYANNEIQSKDGFITLKPGRARAVSGKDLQGFDTEDALRTMEGRDEITIRELDCGPDKEYLIINLTTERIAIQHNIFPDREFFVPGAGSRQVSGKTLIHLDYLLWESQGLIRIDTVPKEAPVEVEESLMGLTMIFLFFILIAGILYALANRENPGVLVPIAIGMVMLVAVAVIFVRKLFNSLTNRRKKEFIDGLKNWLTLLPGIILILGTGIGLPVIIMRFYGPLAPATFLQTGFISIASMLPAFLFYLFGRQQVDEQKENCYREAMVLDPNVWSHSEATSKYGPLLNTVYDTGSSPFSILLLVISTALLVTGWVIALSPIRDLPVDLKNNLDFFFQPYTSQFTLGFLGAYFFTINLVYRRYVRADLTPKTYAYITMRLITTFVLVWAVSTLPQFAEATDRTAAGFAKTGLPALAFIIGIFPESALTIIQDYVNKLTARSRGQKTSQYSLAKLEGMNLYDQARLMEEGIENIENLAHHNLMELVVRTRIPTARLVDMFDQAILYLHLGLEDENQTEVDNLRNLLKGLGVRTATDLVDCKKNIAEIKDASMKKKYATLINQLDIIITSLQDDEWLNYIKCWRENSVTESKLPIDDPYKFYIRAMGIEEAHAKEKQKREAQKKEKSNPDHVEPSDALQPSMEAAAA